MSRFIKLIFSGEFMFAVFLMGGAFKEVLPIGLIDLTVLMFITSFLVGMKRLYNRRNINKKSILPIVLFAFIVILISISMFYTPSIYAVDKYMRFLIITSWAFVGSLLLITDAKSLNKFIYSLLIIAMFSSFFILYNYFRENNVSGFVGLSDGNYLGSARLVGIGVLSILVLFIYKVTKPFYKSLLFVSLLTSILAIVVTGARMPSISLFLVIVLLLLTSISFRKRKITIKKGTKFLFGILFSMLPIAYLSKDSQMVATLIRRIEVLINEGGASAFGRLDRFEVSLGMFSDNPLLGKGFGSFGLYYLGVDIREYPHNIFLEIASEVGLLALITFAILLFISVNKSRKYLFTSNHYHIWIFATLTYLLLNALVSGDLNDNRTLFAFVGIAYQSEFYIDNIKDNFHQIKNRVA